MRRLLIRPGAIGDCILALPALESLKADYTEAWAPSAVVPLIRFADRVRALSGTGIDLLGLPGVAAPARLLKELAGFDSIVSWYGANREEFREAVAGFGFQFHAALPDPFGGKHCADFFAEQVGARVPAIPRIVANASRRRDTIIVHPFSGSPNKNWPLQRYRELARRLGSAVEWCAGPEDELAGAHRFDNLYDLAAWIAGTRVYVGNDSGITHLAAAVGTPVVALFGPMDPAVWAPRGRLVKIVPGPLKNTTVERVHEEIDSLL